MMTAETKVVPLRELDERAMWESHEEINAALDCRCASEIALEHVEWVWPGRLARGKHTAIGGDPGGGKSNLTMYIAATVSMAAEWPCGEGRAPHGSVLILSAEDGASDTIIPRLHACEADLGRVHIVSAVKQGSDRRRSFNLQADLKLLEQKIDELGDVVLVIIDPVSSYLGKTDSHKNAEVRGVLEPLSEMAERKRVAVLSVTHFSKGGATNGTKAILRFIGSIAFIGAPRIAFALIEDSDNPDRRLLLHAKNNLAPPPQGLAFKLRQCLVGKENIATSAVSWDAEPVSITADQALAADTGGESRPCDEAESFLKEALSNGAVPAKQLKAEAGDYGLSWATVRRAKKKIGIATKRDGFGPGSVVLWEMPSRFHDYTEREDDDSIGAQNSIDAHVNKVSTYEENEHLCSQDSQKEVADPTDYPEIPAFLDRRASGAV